MPFIEFPTEDEGVTILVETDEAEIETTSGVEKAGIFGRKADAGHAIAVARQPFTTAVGRIVRENVRALTDAVDELATAPNEVELTFGLKATGEVGNIAIAKVGAEATFQLRLVWKPEDSAPDNQVGT